MQYPLLFRRPFPRPLVFLGFPASKAAEMVPQKHQNCRFCNTRSFSEGHFQGPLYFLDFLLPRLPKWEEHHKSTKIVDFAIPGSFSEAISKAPCIFSISGFQGRRNGSNPTKAPNRGHFQGPSYFLDFQLPRPPKWGALPEAISNAPWIAWISGFQGHRNGWNTTKAPKLSIWKHSLLFRWPSPRPLVFLGFSASKAAEMGANSTKAQTLSILQYLPCISWVFPASKAAEMGGNPTKAPKLTILQYPLLSRLDFLLPEPSKWGEHHKSRRPFPRPFRFPGFPASKANCRFCNTCSFSGGHFQGPLDFLDFWLPGSSHGGNGAPTLSILQYSLLFRQPFPRPLAFL